MTEVYTFSLLKEDRLLVVGTGNMEMEVYELTWLEQSEEPVDEDQEKENEPVPKKQNLVGNEAFNTEDDQGNNVLRCTKRGNLLRKAKGRALQICVTSDESLLCCLVRYGSFILFVFREVTV